MRDNQHTRIIDYIKKNGSITTLDAFRDLGITKLTTRISEMRKKGMLIEGKVETVKNRYGDKCHIHRYKLKEENKQLAIGENQ